VDDQVELTAREKLPAIVVATAGLLAESNLTVQKLIKGMAHIGCTCVVKSRLTMVEEHDQFCRFRMKLEDLELTELVR
jgi:hypothetical protein